MITEIAIATAIAALITQLTVSRIRTRRELQKSAEQIRSMQKDFEEELSRTNEQRNRLLDALGDPFLLVDTAGTVRFVNAAARELFGDRDIVNRSFRVAFLDPRLADPLHHCLETGQAVQSRIVLPQQSSPRGNLENRGINAWIIDAARLPAQQINEPITRVIIRDVTTEHQTEQIRKDFVANASHELRTPMAIINGYLENLLEDNMIEDATMARHFLSIMRKHSDRISRIVEDMLVISRLESGEANSLKIEPFRFRSCVNDVLERLESVIRSQNVKIRIEMQDEGPILHGDRFYWTQVLFNLVENSLKQNPHPGLQVEIGCQDVDNLYRIWVMDNGIGIPSADLPHIFRRFYRVEKHHSQREIKGTGLGLSIVKRAIEAHGGTITVTSVPGMETKFVIEVEKKS